MQTIALFFAGAFLCNCIPHLAAGLRGEPFPTPFATPHGIGDSSPLVNFLWGAANAVVGLALLTGASWTIGVNIETLAFLLGALPLGAFMSRHFGKVRAGRK
ncbi:MAG: hypothetical protein JO107_05165 [Hyphomicrobiales bacterium]|nr:hypothetical protein [Hyphomicrobiales bacterium]MBV8662471.1 hypothetical protein [Hyphomicrobiales bacterium]